MKLLVIEVFILGIDRKQIPGAVGGIFSVTILLLASLFAKASTLDCFSIIVFIGGGVLSFSSFAAAGHLC
jgi:hypothetical protein